MTPKIQHQKPVNKKQERGRASVLDWAIAYISPKSGVRRQLAKMHSQRLSKINNDYRGAHTDRTNADWRTRLATADAQILHSTPELIARSRWIVMNTSEGRSALLAYRRNVVGSSGIRPHANVFLSNGKPDTVFNDAADSLFKDWATDKRLCDFEKRNTFYGQQRQAVIALVATGETFNQHPIIGTGRQSHIAIQRFEYDQLNRTITSFGKNGNEVRYGIEVDKNGTAVAYHFYDRPNNDASLRRYTKSIRILEKDMEHVYDSERAGQSHGVPLLHAILPKVRDLMEYEKWELFKARVQACLTVFIENPENSGGAGDFLDGDSDDDGTDKDGNPEAVFKPGLTVEGEAGQKLSAAPISSPHDAYVPYAQQQKRDIAAGVGTSYEQLARDFTNGSYSSQRQTLLEDHAEFKICQQLLIDKFCGPTWKAFITLEVLKGTLKAPGFFTNPARYLAVTWVAPGISWIDPLKQAKANILTNRANQASLQEIYASRGLDWKHELRQLALEKEFREELGLVVEDVEQDVSMLEQNENASAPPHTNGNRNGHNRLYDRLLYEVEIPE